MHKRFYVVLAVLAATLAVCASSVQSATSRSMQACYHYCAWHNGVPCGRDHDGWEVYDVNEGQWWICRSIAPWTQWEDWEWFSE